MRSTLSTSIQRRNIYTTNRIGYSTSTSGLKKCMNPTEYIVNYLDEQGQMRSALVQARDPGNAVLVFTKAHPNVAQVKSVLPTQQWFDNETDT